MNNDVWSMYRDRIKHEDTLLNERTNLFLVVNGLGAVALGNKLEGMSDIVMILVIFIANIFWLFGASQTARVINSLTSEYIKNSDDPIDLVQGFVTPRLSYFFPR